VDPVSVRLEWRRTTIAGRAAAYGEAGSGRPVVFLHGWGLGHRAYKRALRPLVERGARVIAPALPGFGGTAALPPERFSLEGYGSWVLEFLDAVGVSEEAVFIGHSFGGGVAISAAARAPERVALLVVVNSIGGSAWVDGRGALRAMTERPLWDWGLHLPDDIWPVRQARRVLPRILEDAVGNVARDPLGLWRVGRLARRANLAVELELLKQSGAPVVVLCGERTTTSSLAAPSSTCAQSCTTRESSRCRAGTRGCSLIRTASRRLRVGSARPPGRQRRGRVSAVAQSSAGGKGPAPRR
jgi:pimeloyl-ACP methyl ester carboxylesterase